MKPAKPELSRRRFCQLLLATAATVATPLLAGCSPFQPLPFVVGEAVPPPLGCSELLARDPRGDC